jgi:hypothetical protein
MLLLLLLVEVCTCVRVWHLCEFASFWHLQWQPEIGQE